MYSNSEAPARPPNIEKFVGSLLLSTLRGWPRSRAAKRKGWVVPIPSELADEIRGFQRKLGAVGGWVFAAEM
jgi:hypothetical protein